MKIITVDLNFLGSKGDIATYMLPYSGGIVLIDPGPETTLPALISALKSCNLTPRDVTKVLITHIHLDHAGAAGWFAGQGAQVYVHPSGVEHMLNPEKLVASATRLYGDQMDTLWGEMKPIPAGKLNEVHDEMEIVAGELTIQALYTPGHAEHHISYKYGDVLFSGDVGGVRYRPNTYLRLPFVPPETNLEEWRCSLERMMKTKCSQIAPTHFGIYCDAEAHLSRALQFLNEAEAWLMQVMPGIRDVEGLRAAYAEYLHGKELRAGLNESVVKVYEGGSPTNFAAMGLFRYWQKNKKST
jgi:glyoxylase-like metal-dependent hydrolase (beta-lactamase superfamily II)